MIGWWKAGFPRTLYYPAASSYFTSADGEKYKSHFWGDQKCWCWLLRMVFFAKRRYKPHAMLACVISTASKHFSRGQWLNTANVWHTAHIKCKEDFTITLLSAWKSMAEIYHGPFDSHDALKQTSIFRCLNVPSQDTTNSFKAVKVLCKCLIKSYKEGNLSCYLLFKKTVRFDFIASHKSEELEKQN